MTGPARVVVLGIDAASPELLRRWAADGTMPNLKALMDRGVVGRTVSNEGFYIASTWPSLYTGLDPSGHGFHYSFQITPGTYEYHTSTLQLDAFWDHMSRAGRRVAIFDIPLSRTRSPLNGIHVTDWSGIEATYGFSTLPPELRQEIGSRWPYPLDQACDGHRRGPREFGALVDKLVRGARLRGELTEHYLRQGGWDFFMQVFTEAHCVGHQCWHLHDPAHPAHDPRISARLGDPLKRVYAQIDSSIGQIVRAAGDARVVVFTAHDMSWWFGPQFLLQEVLIKLGVSHPLPSPPHPPVSGGLLRETARRVWRLLPKAVRAAIRPGPARIHARDAPPPPLPPLGVDPLRSRCFVVRNGHVTGGIRLNLIGREPNGLLAPGQEADAFCAALIRDLLEIVDERTGRPVAVRVRRTADLYHGARLDQLPDLLVDWDDAVPTGSVHHAGGAAARVTLRSPRIGVVEAVNGYTRTGDHRIGGMFVAAGGGIRPGVMERQVSVMDLGPSFAAMVGVEMPGTDGKPIPELLP